MVMMMRKRHHPPHTRHRVGIRVCCPRVGVVARSPLLRSRRRGLHHLQASARGDATRVKLVGGKGGVGKTTLATSLAVSLAVETQEPTLVVSTDPAHSLSDALGQDVSGGVPVRVETASAMPLWALEIDPAQAKREISDRVAAEAESAGRGDDAGGGFGSSVRGMLKAVGIDVDPDAIRGLNLGELLSSPPPGFDEVIAVAKIMDFVASPPPPPGTSPSAAADLIDVAVSDGSIPQPFASIVVDTAPTGHTLRLLAAPEFLDKTLDKLIAVRRMLDGASQLVKTLLTFGGAGGQGAGGDGSSLTERIEDVQRRLRAFGALLRDAKRCEFIAVTVPTQMAVSETIALAQALSKERVPLSRCVCNQVLPGGTDGMADGGVALARLRRKDQDRALAMLEADPALSRLDALQSPLLDLEVRGVPALQYFGRGLWHGSGIVREAAGDASQRFVIVGGKGGVGKTTSAASLALSFAEEGHTVLVVSTDPAHSLGDSLAQSLPTGGAPVMLEGTDLPVWAMEIDPQEAMAKLRKLVRRAEEGDFSDEKTSAANGGNGGGMGDGGGAFDLGAILGRLQDLKLDELLENPPPGTDEAIAVAKVVQFSESPEYARFTRVVIDTAPTGHTLRLLTLPSFVSLSIEKILKFRSVIGQAIGKSKGDQAIEALEELQRQMERTEAILRDKEATEFVVVSIPTYLSVAESSRLVQALGDEEVRVRHIVVNQVLDFGSSNGAGAGAGEGEGENEERIARFMRAKARDQQQALDRLKNDPATSNLEIIESPIVNMEVRGVPALEYFASVVWSEKEREMQQAATKA